MKKHIDMKKHKGVKIGWGGLDFEKSRHFEKMPDQSSVNRMTPEQRKKFKKDQVDNLKGNTIDPIDDIGSSVVDDSRMRCKLNVDAINSIDDIKLILKQLDLPVYFDNKEDYDKLEHLLMSNKK